MRLRPVASECAVVREGPDVGGLMVRKSAEEWERVGG